MRIESVENKLKSEGYSAYDFEEDFTKIDSDILVYHGRWELWLLDIWADEDGHVFGIYHNEPATEYQDGMDTFAEMVPVHTVESWIHG